MTLPTNSELSTQASNQPSPPNKVQAMLAGASQVFANHGYKGASMDRIAAAAGVSKSTLYSHFQGKEGLFVALIQRATQRNRQRVFNLLSDPNLQDPPEQVLRQIATLVLQEFANSQPLLRLMRLIIAESERFPALAQTFVREIQKPILEQLSLYLAAQRQLDLPDPVVAARVFAGSLMHYLIIQNLLHGKDIVPLEQERMIDGLVELITAKAKPADQD